MTVLLADNHQAGTGQASTPRSLNVRVFQKSGRSHAQSSDGQMMDRCCIKVIGGGVDLTFGVLKCSASVLSTAEREK